MNFRNHMSKVFCKMHCKNLLAQGYWTQLSFHAGVIVIWNRPFILHLLPLTQYLNVPNCEVCAIKHCEMSIRASSVNVAKTEIP